MTTVPFTRKDGRAVDELRPVTMTRHWLDHAIGGGGSFARWSYQVDAAYKMLEQSAAEFGVERLPETVTRVKIQTPVKAFGPCHACQLVYSRCGVPASVFVTAPSPAP